jgi:hypothetical protein
MKNKIHISVSLDDNDLMNVLKENIKNKEMQRLLYDVLSKDSVACNWLFKMQLGATYPTIPEKGTVGYVNVDKTSGWSGDLGLYKDSHFNQNGFIQVTVDEFIGLNEYYPLKVIAPEHTDETGKVWKNNFRVNIQDFIPEDQFDPYDKSI